jgi:hypothetical protein
MPFAHVGMAGRELDPDAARDWDHRASDRRTPVTSFAGASAAIRTTEPPISTSIAGGDGGALSRGSAPTTTGAKPTLAWPVPHRSRRHRQIWLGRTSADRATSATIAPGANAASINARFCSSLH